jgi:hypothetical protein
MGQHEGAGMPIRKTPDPPGICAFRAQHTNLANDP